jgi:hypothetical protein
LTPDEALGFVFQYEDTIRSVRIDDS